MNGVNKYKVRLFFYLSVITVSLGASFIVFITVVRPIFIQRLQYYGEKTATEVVNNAISDVFSAEGNDFSELISLDKNSDGTVSALKTDTIEMNRLRADITNALEDELTKIDTGYVNIPMGSIMGNELFAGMGPDVKIKIRPVGLISVDFYDDFESCGINQSRHTIYMQASVDVSVITQQAKTTSKISAKIPVSETVIIGNVPKYYGTNSSLKTTLDE